jgi:hypothetical protein
MPALPVWGRYVLLPVTPLTPRQRPAIPPPMRAKLALKAAGLRGLRPALQGAAGPAREALAGTR